MDLRYKDDEGAIKSSRLLIEAHGSLEELAVKLGTNLETGLAKPTADDLKQR
jgi:hypothetical protein